MDTEAYQKRLVEKRKAELEFMLMNTGIIIKPVHEIRAELDVCSRLYKSLSGSRPRDISQEPCPQVYGQPEMLFYT